MYKEDRLKKQRKQEISRGFIDSQLREGNYLKTLQNTRDFDKNLFDKGKLWFDSGLSLEDADEKLKNDISFVKGFNHGARLDYINKMDNPSKKR